MRENEVAHEVEKAAKKQAKGYQGRCAFRSDGSDEKGVAHPGQEKDNVHPRYLANGELPIGCPERIDDRPNAKYDGSTRQDHVHVSPPYGMNHE